MIICVTGTPGTGKTYFAKKLAKKMHAQYVDVNKELVAHKIYTRYDRQAKTYDIDEKKAKAHLQKYVRDTIQKKKQKKQTIRETTIPKALAQAKKSQGSIILDSHISHIIPADMCVVMRSDIKTIASRLRKRTYPQKKIQDNIESEIFGICLEEAQKTQQHIIIVNN